MTIGEKLRALRKQRAISVKELSNATGITVQTLYNIESGRNKKPRNPTIYKLAEFFSVEPDWFFDPDAPLPPAPPMPPAKKKAAAAPRRGRRRGRPPGRPRKVARVAGVEDMIRKEVEKQVTRVVKKMGVGASPYVNDPLAREIARRFGVSRSFAAQLLAALDELK